MRFFLFAAVSCLACFSVIRCKTVYSQQTTPPSTAAQEKPWSKYFEREVTAIEAATEADLTSVTKENWGEKQAAWRTELRSMLGLEPQPERSDLKVTVTGTLHHAGVSIQRLHYQARPGLYVPANLYLPEGETPTAGWPAVLYVCGHARVESQGRLLGNKTGYHHHGLWFARHGVACLIIDTVQLGELHGEHHGTYKLGRWDWVSRGYTPAGVEAWNAIRGLDLLEAWPGIDSKRLGITGRSGGGAYSWYAAALDDRIRVAVPVAGITDLQNHVVDGCVEGHCDCMYMVNYFRWDYSKLAALVAPRPLLLANSDNDTIFPLDGVLRTHHSVAKVYSQLGASENLGLLITPGPHKDTQELQVGAFKWLLRNLLGVEPVIDSPALKELTPEQLAVFDREIPANERVAEAGAWFTQAAAPENNPQAAMRKWTEQWLPKLKLTALKLPLDQLETAVDFSLHAKGVTKTSSWKLYRSSDRDGYSVSILAVESPGSRKAQFHFGLFDSVDLNDLHERSIDDFLATDDVQQVITKDNQSTHYFFQARNANWQSKVGTVKSRTHTVRRFYLLGQMPEQLALADSLHCLKWIRKNDQPVSIGLNGSGRTAPLAALAALLCNSPVSTELPKIAALQVRSYPRDAEAGPSLPGLLREVSYESLLAAAKGVLEVTELEGSSMQSIEPLVDSSIEPQQATGMRIVEVDRDRAAIWVRATRWSLPNLADLAELQFESPMAKGTHNRGPMLPSGGVDGLRYAVPGVKAEVRVSYRPMGKGNWVNTDWVQVDAGNDYSTVIKINQLNPDTAYEIRTAARAIGHETVSTLNGKFKTLPSAESESNFRLAVGTCQDFPDRDGPHGFDVYRTMVERRTDAFVMAGDVVYYDKLARSVPLAHYHWQQTYGLPTLQNFHRQVPTYFLKDDHDTYVNDSWPGTRFKWTEDFTFEDGQRIFIQQTGLPSPAYRTLRVGKDLQVWLMEGRDYRSPNNAADGPEKSIWGAEQKAWLASSLAESKAKFKVLISPTPIVGPDRDNKHDNHSNAVFATEGNEIRKMLGTHANLVSVCGDRHWQYHSVDPATGLHEFSVGPVSDRHAGGWDQKDYRADMHRFLRVGGGYLEIELSGVAADRKLTLRHFDTHGNEQHSYSIQ